MSESRLDAAVTEYLKAAEAGQKPDAEEWATRYPEVAAQLRSFIEQHAKMEGLAARLAEAATVAPGQGVEAPRLRYVGDYELLGEIARGGMGVVFRARQTSLGREVAVKMMLSGALAGGADLARFKAEAESAAGLDHPNVLPLYEVGEHEGLPYFSMKLVEGGNLAGLVPELVKDHRRAAHLVALVARAVDHAHKRGVLHRDLKPANVLIDRDGTPYVSDFGLAKRAADSGQTQTGQVLGTPSYMAPEQARGEKALTVSADVYSLGAILYECLTGKPPFVGPTAFDTVMQVVEAEPEPVPGDLGVIALKCLAKEPGRRYASAGELADDLLRWLGGEPIQARPVGRLERAWMWARRNPVVAALSAACLLSVVCGVAASLKFALDATHEARQAARAVAEQREQESRLALARSHVNNGDRLLEEGDELGALVWYAEALKLEADGGGRERMHRLRVGMVLHHAPRLERVAMRSDQRIEPDIAPEYYLVSSPNKAAIHERATGKLVGEVAGPKEQLAFEFAPGHALATMSYGTEAPVGESQHPEGVVFRLYDLRTARPLSPARLVKPGPRKSVFTHDGRRVVMHLTSGHVAVLDLMTGRQVSSARKFGDLKALAPTPDVKRLLVADTPGGLDDEGTLGAVLYCLSLETLAEEGVPVKARLRGDSWSPACRLLSDGRHVVAVGTNEAVVYSVTDGQKRRSLPLAGAEGVVVADTRPLVAVFGKGGVRLFDLAGAGGWPAPAGGPAQDVTFSPGLTSVAVMEGASKDRVRVYAASDGRPLTPSLYLGFLDDGGWFSPDGRLVRTVTRAGLERTWLVGGRGARRVAGPHTWAVFSGDLGRVAACGRGGFRVFDTRTGRAVGPRVDTGAPRDSGPDVSLNEGGTLALAGQGGRYRVYDVARGTGRDVPAGGKDGWAGWGGWAEGGRLVHIQFGKGAETAEHYFDARTLAPVRPRGERRLLEGKGVALWDIGRGRAVELSPPAPSGRVRARLRGGVVLAVSEQRELFAWDAGTGKRLWSRALPEGEYSLLYLSADGKRAALVCQPGDGGTQMRLVDTAEGELVGSPIPLARGVLDVHFSAGNERVAVLTDLDNGLRVYDAATGAPLTGHIRWPAEVPPRDPFSPDGALVFAGGRLYDAATGGPIGPAGVMPPDMGRGGFRADGAGLVFDARGRAWAPKVVKASPDDAWLLYEPLVRAEGRPEELLARAELLAGRRLGASGGLVELSPEEVLQRWKAARR